MLPHPQILKNLVVAQNDALHVIMDPHNWCRLANPQTESGLPSLHHRILARTESIATKLIRTRPVLSVSPNWFRPYDSHITMYLIENGCPTD